MIELVILCVGFAALVYNAPRLAREPDEQGKVGLPRGTFASNRAGYSQPTVDELKRTPNYYVPNPLNAYNDSALTRVNRNPDSPIFTQAFREKYAAMLTANRLRPAPELQRFWPGQTQQFSQTVGNTVVGTSSGPSPLQTDLPFRLAVDYVPARFAGPLGPYKH